MVFEMKELLLIPSFSVREFADYLAEHFDQDVADAFEKNEISGSSFLKLTESAGKSCASYWGYSGASVTSV